MIITIDGLSANGKSTLAKMISDKLDLKNFNTGAIYRCIALKILEDNLDINDISNVIRKVQNIQIYFENEKTFLDGKDVSNKIRDVHLTEYSTQWGSIPQIKDVVRHIQKEFIAKFDTVMEGRDIGTRIAPNADFKFYLYSDFESRVKRLWKINKTINIDTIRKNLKRRDEIEISNKDFVKPKNAIEIDTTNYSLEDVYNIMINNIKLKRKEED